jgi:hypothetical protein
MITVARCLVPGSTGGCTSVATQEQYEFFRTLYEDEEHRYEQLEARAKLYLSVITVFLAAVILKAEEVQKSASALKVPWWLLLAEAVLLATTLLFVVLGVLIRSYEAVTSPRDIIKSFGNKPPSNEDFFDARIADFTVATERNVKVNDRAALFLTIAGILLALSMLSLISILTMALLS